MKFSVAAGNGLHLIGDGKIIAFAPSPALNYLCLSKNGHDIYATGRQEIFKFTLRSGKLVKQFSAPCGGNVACYLSLSPDEKRLFCANYISGGLTEFSIEADSFKLINRFQPAGTPGNNAARQEAPHMHCCNLLPDNKILGCCDLGLDTLSLYSIDNGEVQTLQFPSGTGPRHIAAVAKNMFMVSELSSMLYRIAYDLKITGSVCTAQGDAAQSQPSAVRISPDGKSVAVANRGENSIVLVNAETMQIEERIDCGGEWPRDFIFTGQRSFAVCNERSNALVFIGNDRVIQKISLSQPMCVSVLK